MKLNNKLYDILKWVALIGLNAIGELYKTLASIWDLPYGNEILQTCSAIALCIGILIGVSTYNYNRIELDDDTTKDDELLEERDE